MASLGDWIEPRRGRPPRGLVAALRERVVELEGERAKLLLTVRELLLADKPAVARQLSREQWPNRRKPASASRSGRSGS